MAKFKVGQRVYEHSEYGFGIVSDIDRNGNVLVLPDSGYPDVWFGTRGLSSLMLTGRPFNLGDRVVVGGEKGVIDRVIDAEKTAVRADFGVDTIWLTTDGRAWPGTPIIAEHDWEEEGGTENPEQEKEAFDISPGFAKDWPIDNGIEDVTVNTAEVRHIAEMQNWQEIARKKDTELIKEQHNYARMALKLTGFELDKEAAALITETVKKVLELGGEFSLDTACEVESRVNQMYDEKA